MAWLETVYDGAAVAYWLERRIQDRNEDFEREFDSRWWILFRKFEILNKSCTITAVIIYRCYPVTPSRRLRIRGLRPARDEYKLQHAYLLLCRNGRQSVTR